MSQRSPSNPPPTPQITSVQWGGGSARVGEEVTLTANLSNQYPNAAVYFEIFPEGSDKPCAKRAVTMKDNKGEVKWRYHYKHDPEHPLTAKPKFTFKATSFKCEPQESSEIEFGQDLVVEVLNERGRPVKNQRYKLLGPDGNEQEGNTGDEGKIEERDMIPGHYEITLIKEE